MSDPCHRGLLSLMARAPRERGGRGLALGDTRGERLPHLAGSGSGQSAVLRLQVTDDGVEPLGVAELDELLGRPLVVADRTLLVVRGPSGEARTLQLDAAALGQPRWPWVTP